MIKSKTQNVKVTLEVSVERNEKLRPPVITICQSCKMSIHHTEQIVEPNFTRIKNALNIKFLAPLQSIKPNHTYSTRVLHPYIYMKWCFYQVFIPKFRDILQLLHLLGTWMDQ